MPRKEYIAWFDMPKSGKLHGQSVMPKQELIRCKDCKHWKYEDSGTDGTVQGECDLMCIFSDGMFFCAGAERKEE